MSQTEKAPFPHLTHNQTRPSGPFNMAVYGVEPTPGNVTETGSGARDTRKIGGPK